MYTLSSVLGASFSTFWLGLRCLRILLRDWHDYYRQSPALLETFVEKDRFEGTCYKAANWLQVGVTKGRGKYDQHTYSKPIKAVFVYPLRKDFREVLLA